MAILGLTSTETFGAPNNFFASNNRRRIFYEYPNGTAPLIGLLSMMEEESTDNPEFGWFEKRFYSPQTELDSISAGNGAFSATGSDTPLATGSNLVIGTIYRIRVVSSSEFREGHVIWIRALSNDAATAVLEIKGVVTEIISATKIEFRTNEAYASILNDDDTVANTVSIIGTANQEGGTSTTGRWVTPVNPSNFTQIFRNAFSFTSTALKVPLKFDRTGAYRDKAKDNGLDHMTQMELAFLFGAKRIDTVTTADGEQVPERKTGGITWFLRQWELGNVANGGAFDYRPSGSGDFSDVTGEADSHDLKRIIRNTSGSITKKTFDTYLQRAFEITNNKTFEKLVLCGSGFLSAANQMFENYSVTNKGFASEDTYGMNVMKQETPHGTVFYKTHPLFSRDPLWRYSAFILDVQNLRYRPLNERDTILLKNRQANDADRRKDEWLTEAGIEVRFPESHMFIQNVQSII